MAGCGCSERGGGQRCWFDDGADSGGKIEMQIYGVWWKKRALTMVSDQPGDLRLVGEKGFLGLLNGLRTISAVHMAPSRGQTGGAVLELEAIPENRGGLLYY